MLDVADLGTILGIWAHPDDETFACAGLTAQAVKNGQKATCITATRGEAGVYDPVRWPPEQLADIRQTELDKALEVLGISEHYWLSYHDGHCDEVSTDQAVADLLSLVNKIKPDTIISFAPDGLTGHDDHRAVARWSEIICAKLPNKPRLLQAVILDEVYRSHLSQMDEKLNIFFNIDRPRLYERANCRLVLDLSDELLDLKCQALRLMPSQTAGMTDQFSIEFIAKAFGVESFITPKLAVF